MGRTAIRRAFFQGYADRQRNNPATQNPYGKPFEFEQMAAWFEGYTEADNDIRTKENNGNVSTGNVHSHSGSGSCLPVLGS